MKTRKRPSTTLQGLHRVEERFRTACLLDTREFLSLAEMADLLQTGAMNAGSIANQGSVKLGAVATPLPLPLAMDCRLHRWHEPEQLCAAWSGEL